MTNSSNYPYYSLNQYYREQFGEKVYKVSLDAGMTCPNRDGTLGDRGCIFCSAGGSGDFAGDRRLSITEQINQQVAVLHQKRPLHKFIAYFQAFTNTYAPISYLRKIYTEALSHPDIAGLSIGTRPDCLDDEVLSLLGEINQKKPVTVELGLQTIHESTANYIRRGYPLSVFDSAVDRLRSISVTVVVHVILGLPGESACDMLSTIQYLNQQDIQGIKLQLLHVLQGTDLASEYYNGVFDVLTKDEYIHLVLECIRHLRPDIVIHRLTGDGDAQQLIEPMWSLNKRSVLNELHHRMAVNQIHQGDLYERKEMPASAEVRSI